MLRRIMRRAMRHAHMLGCKDPLMCQAGAGAGHGDGRGVPELGRAESLMTETLPSWRKSRFKETLGSGAEAA